MCNLFSMTKGQQVIRELSRAMRDTTGNLPLLPGVFPDYPAPIIRTAADGVRELAMTRWGMGVATRRNTAAALTTETWIRSR